MEAPHECHVDVLEPMRSDEVEAAVDHRVLVAQTVVVARGGRRLGDELLLEQALDVRSDHIEALLADGEFALCRYIYRQTDRQIDR